uniref:Uncharacterized protein n=1 Tax=Naja naja TaxID=35670 RepID=A0A8C6VD08_NAJNA
MELEAELTGRDGLKRAWRVRCEPPGELRGLLAGLSRLREEVTARLDPLVQQESVAAAGDRDERGGEGLTKENHVKALSNMDGGYKYLGAQKVMRIKIYLFIYLLDF